MGRKRWVGSFTGRPRRAADLTGRPRRAADLTGRPRRAADLRGRTRRAAGFMGRTRRVGASVASGLVVATLAAFASTVFAALAGFASTATATGPTTAGITLHASSTQVHSGKSVTLTGQVTNAPSGSQVKLYRRAFPYTVAQLMATVTPSTTGNFSYDVTPYRNTQYAAILTGTAARATVRVGVMWPTKIVVEALPLGQAGISIIVHHPGDLHWSGARVRWFFKTSAHRHFYEAAPSHTQHLTDTVLRLHTVLTLPAGRFQWRACFYAPEARALLNPKRPPGCEGRGYSGTGSLPNGFPGPDAVARAAAYEAHRSARTSFALMDSEGRLSGRNIHWTFTSASVSKAMLLVAYLRQKEARGQETLTSYDTSILTPMIEYSDNNAATRCWQLTGYSAGLYAVARAAHMTDFSVPTGFWANSQISAADQARYFFEMDSLIPPEFVGYARYLLSHIVSYESWGVPAVARPRGYQVFFKGGWVPPYIVNQVARLEGHDKRFAIAVLTQNDPSFAYGIDTIQGVTGVLLGLGAAAGPAPVLGPLSLLGG